MRKKPIRTVIMEPLIVMVLLLGVVLLAHRGLQAEARPAQLSQLESVTAAQADSAPVVLLLTDERLEDLTNTVTDTLDEMRMGWRTLPASSFTMDDLEGIETLLFCTQELGAADEEELVKLADWVESGGRMALMIMPMADEGFSLWSHKLGVIDYAPEVYEYSALAFESGFLPFFDDLVFDEALSDYAMNVRLEADCIAHMFTGDQARIPLLWTRELGKGRVAVFNASLINGKDSRGYALNVMRALEDRLLYPIINAGMVYIDDFPAPQPEGFNDQLKQRYGFDIQGFFRNHWWPDMKQLTWTKGLRYTGVLIETYNDIVEPPFERDNDDNALVRYYASEILQSGGEIGLHGYNHQPLCTDGFVYAGEGYTLWPSLENMSLAIKELLRYGEAFLPNAQFVTYVPPSNYLSAEGQRVLLETVPELRTLSGLYLPEAGVNALTQEFTEEADGSISVPRITSGFSVDGYNKLMIAQELALHGVFSHFIHPDDVLDVARGAELGWEKMLADFETMLEGVAHAYPALRWSTASEGAAAVQRYDRASVKRTRTEKGLALSIAPFYDEIWLALWCESAPVVVENAELYRMADGLYWLKATSADVRLEWGDEQ